MGLSIFIAGFQATAAVIFWGRVDDVEVNLHGWDFGLGIFDDLAGWLDAGAF